MTFVEAVNREFHVDARSLYYTSQASTCDIVPYSCCKYILHEPSFPYLVVWTAHIRRTREISSISMEDSTDNRGQGVWLARRHLFEVNDQAWYVLLSTARSLSIISRIPRRPD